MVSVIVTQYMSPDWCKPFSTTVYRYSLFTAMFENRICPFECISPHDLSHLVTFVA